MFVRHDQNLMHVYVAENLIPLVRLSGEEGDESDARQQLL